jgi:hypothetical protein
MTKNNELTEHQKKRIIGALNKFISGSPPCDDCIVLNSIPESKCEKCQKYREKLRVEEKDKEKKEENK